MKAVALIPGKPDSLYLAPSMQPASITKRRRGTWPWPRRCSQAGCPGCWPIGFGGWTATGRRLRFLRLGLYLLRLGLYLLRLGLYLLRLGLYLLRLGL